MSLGAAAFVFHSPWQGKSRKKKNQNTKLDKAICQNKNKGKESKNMSSVAKSVMFCFKVTLLSKIKKK